MDVTSAIGELSIWGLPQKRGCYGSHEDVQLHLKPLTFFKHFVDMALFPHLVGVCSCRLQFFSVKCCLIGEAVHLILQPCGMAHRNG